jgi:hypothetical protein
MGLTGKNHKVLGPCLWTQSRVWFLAFPRFWRPPTFPILWSVPYSELVRASWVFLLQLSFAFTSKNPCDYTRPTQVIWGHPISRLADWKPDFHLYLNPPCYVTQHTHRFQRLERGQFGDVNLSTIFMKCFVLTPLVMEPWGSEYIKLLLFNPSE